MHLALVLVLLSAAPAPPSPAADTAIPVLFMPLVGKGGVPADVVDQFGAALVAEAAKVKGYRMLSVREVEGLLTQEQMKQNAGCSDQSCALELAGALNTREVVLGSLGVLDREYLVTLSRLDTKTAQVLGRVSERVKDLSLSGALDRIPGMVATLFGTAPLAEPAAVKPAEPTPPPPQASPLRLPLRVAGGVGAALGAALLVVALGALGSVAASNVYDVALGYNPLAQDSVHHVTAPVAMVLNGVLGVGAGALVLALLAGVVGLALLISSWVVA